MSTEMTTKDFIPEPQELRARLNSIIQTVPRFWEQRLHLHFTNQGPPHSERVYRQKLAPLAQELPESERLSSEEIFIVSAAAWLYEIGMQSRDLRGVLGTDYHPGDVLTPSQLELVRAKKHLLSERMILQSARGEPIPLGLTQPGDGYTTLIATVCRWCSNEPLDEVPDKLPIHGINIRVRLLVALLRLADQLYIDASRVSLDRLESAGLPMQQYAKWWMHHYTQTFLERSQIHFHYYIPVTQKNFTGHIRGLTEPAFEHRNNPVIQYLFENQIKIAPQIEPVVVYDQAEGFQREMSRDLVNYLRHTIDPIETRRPDPRPRPVSNDRSLLILDYENLILQMGKEGYFLSLEDTSRLVVDLRSEARNQYDGPVDAVAIGKWDREYLEPAAQMLKNSVYDLISVDNEADFVESVSALLKSRLDTNSGVRQLIVVSPRASLAPLVKRYSDNGLLINAWISKSEDARIYPSIVSGFKPLSQIVSLQKSADIDNHEFQLRESACILRLDHYHLGGEKRFDLDQLHTLLGDVQATSNSVDWWGLWLINQGIVQQSGSQKTFELSLDHPNVIMTRTKRQLVIENLQALSQDGQGVEQDELISRLQSANAFKGLAIVPFLELLKYEGVIQRDARIDITGGKPYWYLNSSHISVIDLRPEKYFHLLILVIDYFLLDSGYPSIHEHTILRRFAPYLGEGIADTVYKLACAEGLLKRQVSEETQRRSNEPLVNVSLNLTHPMVGETLRNLEIIISNLSKKWARNGLSIDALWEKLKVIRSFSLDRSELEQWLQLLQLNSIINEYEGQSSSDNRLIVLNLESFNTDLLHGRMNVHALVRNLRGMRAMRVESAVKSADVVEKLMKYITHGNKEEAGWTLDYAKHIKLIGVERKELPDGPVNYVYLKLPHSFVSKLDRREERVCRALSELVKSLQGNKGNWIERYIILNSMNNDPQFGFTRGEHEYWLDQAIFRLRYLEQDKERGAGPIKYYVRVKE